MASFCKKTFLLLSFITCTQVINAQSLQDSIPVVISLSADNQTNINLVKTKIQGLSNVNYVGFCNNHKVFLIYVDPHFHGSSIVFLSNLIKSTGLYDLTLKEGSVTDIIGFCEFRDPTEHDKNKVQQAN